MDTIRKSMQYSTFNDSRFSAFEVTVFPQQRRHPLCVLVDLGSKHWKYAETICYVTALAVLMEEMSRDMGDRMRLHTVRLFNRGVSVSVSSDVYLLSQGLLLGSLD